VAFSEQCRKEGGPVRRGYGRKRLKDRYLCVGTRRRATHDLRKLSDQIDLVAEWVPTTPTRPPPYVVSLLFTNICGWRRGWDSNPRPLRYLSVEGNQLKRTFHYTKPRLRSPRRSGASARQVSRSISSRPSKTARRAQDSRVPGAGAATRATTHRLQRLSRKNACMRSRHSASRTPHTTSNRWLCPGSSPPRTVDITAPVRGSAAP
jgi:hypothetical protein